MEQSGKRGVVLAGRPYEEMERKLKPLAEQLGISDTLTVLT